MRQPWWRRPDPTLCDLHKAHEAHEVSVAFSAEEAYGREHVAGCYQERNTSVYLAEKQQRFDRNRATVAQDFIVFKYPRTNGKVRETEAQMDEGYSYPFRNSYKVSQQNCS